MVSLKNKIEIFLGTEVNFMSDVILQNDGDGDYIKEWNLDSPQPTESELNTKVAELDAAEPMRLLREERNQLLSETDWMVTRSIETGVAMSNDWKTYRQALRDLPASSSPSLDEFYDLNFSSVTWPTEPS